MRFFERHARSTFVIGFIAGLSLSLASLSTALIAAEVRSRRATHRKKLAQQAAKLGSRTSTGTDGDHDDEEDDDDDDDDDGREEDADWSRIEIRTGHVVRGVEGLIGNTPLMRINSLSDLTGCEILGKAEFLNPGGSPKDRVALQILNDAERAGLLHPRTGSCVFEGTVGSTGISLAILARAKGYLCSIVMPDDVAREKRDLLKALGADLRTVRPRGIADPKHFVNEARRLAAAFGGRDGTALVGSAGDGGDEDGEKTSQGDLVVSSKAIAGGEADDPDALEEQPRGFFADQFESNSNFRAHAHGTGPEIWHQTGGLVTAFVCGAGTGGTLAGVGSYLKRRSKGEAHVVLADPPGSGLFNRVKHGVIYNERESEGTRRRHQVDTVVEGIGLNRLTRNFERGLPSVDDAERVSDDEAVRMSRYLVANDGLFLGSSSAVNVVAAVRTAQKLKRTAGKSATAPVVVTILCDSGARHLSRFWDDEALVKLGLTPSADIADILENEGSS